MYSRSSTQRIAIPDPSGYSLVSLLQCLQDLYCDKSKRREIKNQFYCEKLYIILSKFKLKQKQLYENPHFNIDNVLTANYWKTIQGRQYLNSKRK